MVKIGTTAAQRKLFYQLQKQKQQLEQLGREAGVKQLSTRLKVSEKDVQLMSDRLQGRDASLSAMGDELVGSGMVASEARVSGCILAPSVYS